MEKKSVGKLPGIKIMTLSLAVLLALTGCGRVAEDDELQDALNKNRSSQGDEEQQNTEKDKSGQTIHISYSIDGQNNSKINVDADVKIPNKDDLSVYEIKKSGIDDEYIKKLADSIFDNGEYEYHKPYYCCSEIELDQAKQWIDSVAGLYEKKCMCPELLNQEMRMWKRAKESYSQDHEQNIPDGKYFVKVPFQNDMMYPEITESTVCNFTGKINGADWILCGAKEGKYERVSLYPYFQNEALCSLVSSDDDLNSMNPAMKEEDARSQAQNYLNNLGYKDYELIHTAKTLTKGSDDLATMNGYSYTFAQAYHGIQTAYFDILNPENMWVDLSMTPQQYITIYVNSYGVEQIDFVSYYELGETINVKEFLEFDEMDRIARQYMMGYLQGVASTELLVNNIEVNYMAVSDEDGKLCMVPVWVYELKYQYDNSQQYTEKFCINALNGEPIDTTLISNEFQDSEQTD